MQIPRPRLLFPRDRDPPRDRHLELICGVERVGVVGGVGFDLRHPKLDPLDWVAESLGRAERDRRRYPGRPFLWFPWYGSYSAENQKREASSSPGWRKFSAEKKRAIELEFTPEKEVRDGDIVSLSSSELIDPTYYKMLDTLKDEPVCFAIIQITRADGTVEIVDTPLRFFPRRETLRLEETPRSVVDEIESIIHTSELEEDVFRLVTEARDIASIINNKIWNIDNALQISAVSENDQARGDLLTLVSASIRLGRLLAKADSATNLEPAAERHNRSKQGAKSGGIKSGLARRKSPWRTIARELIIKIRSKHPEYSQSDIASDVSTLWTADEPCPPGHKALEKFVSSMERAGEIQRKAGKPSK